MKQPVHLERKVVVGSLLTLAASAAIAVLNGLNGSQLLVGLPSWAQSLVVVAGPTVLSFLGQYVTKHTARPDLEPAA